MTKPHAHISLITLGVSDIPRSARFYEALGFVRKVEAAGDDIAFLEAGGVVLACWGADQLAQDAGVNPGTDVSGFRGVTLAWNCPSEAEVDTVIAMAVEAGGTCLKPAQKAFFGGYHGFFADPDAHVWEVAHNPHFPLSPEGRPQLPE